MQEIYTSNNEKVNIGDQLFDVDTGEIYEIVHDYGCLGLCIEEQDYDPEPCGYVNREEFIPICEFIAEKLADKPVYGKDRYTLISCLELYTADNYARWKAEIEAYAKY